MKTNLKELAAELYDVGSIKYGNFITKVGLETPIYIDLRVIISYPDLLRRISKLLWNLVNENECTHVCGVPYTALPIATVISTESSIPMLIRRKEAKSYGMKKMVEGIFKTGDKAIIVEDIITSGSSIIETVTDLKNEGLNVNLALVIVDREQGGKKNLENAGITVKSLFTITELIDYIYEAKKITEDSVKIIKNYIKTVQAPLTVKPDSNRLKQNFLTRAKLAKNKVAIKLFEIMSEKQTNLCLAADFTKSQEILDLANLAGPHIAVLKIHLDIIDDYEKNFIMKMKSIAVKHNFLIMEDRKFADIGQIVSNQLINGRFYAIAEWADLITVHPVSGTGVVEGIKNGLDAISQEVGIFVVAEMSSEGSLTKGDYVKSAISNFKDFDLTTGFVCQNNVFKDSGLIQLTPGVKLIKSTDNLGQQYNLPEDVVNSGADLIVVGRGITEAKDKLASVLEYKKILWEAYENRIDH